MLLKDAEGVFCAPRMAGIGRGEKASKDRGDAQVKAFSVLALQTNTPRAFGHQNQNLPSDEGPGVRVCTDQASGSREGHWEGGRALQQRWVRTVQRSQEPVPQVFWVLLQITGYLCRLPKRTPS